jgi:hypothetical protein
VLGRLRLRLADLAQRRGKYLYVISLSPQLAARCVGATISGFAPLLSALSAFLFGALSFNFWVLASDIRWRG